MIEEASAFVLAAYALAAVSLAGVTLAIVLYARHWSKQARALEKLP
jgi:hypothetical protein